MLPRTPIAAVCGLLTIGLAGCLIPYPIEERPIEINYPPFYVEGTISPTPDEIHEFDPRVDLDGVLFRVALDDPNLNDQLEYRWFIDYNRDTGAPIQADSLSPGESGAIAYPFQPCLLPRTGGETIHRIDLFVADRPFLQTPGPPVNQRVADGTGTLALTWFVRLDDRLCR